MKDVIALEKVTSERVGLVERIVIERVYEPAEEATAPTPMLHTNYDALTLEEKVERLEVVAELYFGWINQYDQPNSPKKAVREDCTRYWEEMKHCWESK